MKKKLGIRSTKKQPTKALFHDVVMSKNKSLFSTNNTTPNNIADHPIDSHNIAMTPLDISEGEGQNCNKNIDMRASENNSVVSGDNVNEGKPQEGNKIIGSQSPLMASDELDFLDISLNSSNQGNSIVEFLEDFCIPELDDHQMYWHYL